MSTYHVSFFKNLTGSDGKQCNACQGSIEIHSARSRERAIQAAQRRFARLKRISDWSFYADKLEVTTLPKGRGAMPLPSENLR